MKKLLAILLLAPVMAMAWRPPAGKTIISTVGFAPGTPREQVDYYNKLFVPAINSAEAKKMFDENLMFTVKAEQTPKGAWTYMSRLINQWTPYVKRIPPN
jgi:tripartite-type tricarboxylate transporter receptor subunit TctC